MRQIPSSYRVHILYGKTRMAGLQSRGSHMMIDSVFLAQYINVVDTKPHSHVATAATDSDAASPSKKRNKWEEK